MVTDSGFSSGNYVEEKYISRVAVIGGGGAGLTAAMHLCQESPDEFDVTVMESDDRVGGHCSTFDARMNGVNYPVDPGAALMFSHYDTVLNLFKHVGSDFHPFCQDVSKDGNGSIMSEMKSFVRVCRQQRFLYLIFKPWLYHAVYDTFRLYWNIPKFFKLQDDDPRKYSITLNEFLEEGGYSKAVQDLLVYPISMIQFLQGSGRLSQNAAVNSLRCVIKIISGEYVNIVDGGIQGHADKVAAKLSENTLEKNTKVTSVTRDGHGWVVEDSTGKSRQFDKVMFAVNPAVIMKLLGDNATEEEMELLSLFEETKFTLLFSTHKAEKALDFLDENPSRYEENPGFGWDIPGIPLSKQHYPSYVFNDMFGIPHDELLLVTTPEHAHPEFKTIYRREWVVCTTLPPETLAAQDRLLEMNGERGLYFAGGWLGSYLHEDAVRSGLVAACQINKRPVPWAPTFNIEKKGLGWFEGDPRGIMLESLSMPTRLIVNHSLGLVNRFLQCNIKKEYITLVLPDMTLRSFGNPKQKTKHHLVLRIFDWQFFVRAAYNFHVGFANSYIEGEIAFGGDKRSGIDYGNELACFFHLLRLNQGKIYKMQATSGSFSIGIYVTSVMMFIATWLYSMLFLGNTGIARIRKNFQTHYHELGNCSPKTYLRDAWEETAVLKAVDKFIEHAQLEPQHNVLDINCGYGTACIRAAETIGCRVVGITDSHECKSFAEEVANKKGLSHLVQFHVVDYKSFSLQRPKKFDRVISYEITDFDEQHATILFYAIGILLKPGGQFVIETTTAQDLYNYRERNFLVNHRGVFPGMHCSTIDSFIQSGLNNSSLSLDSINDGSENYSLLLRDCCRRFNEPKNLSRLREVGYNSYFFRCWTYYIVKCNAGLEDKSINRLTFRFSNLERKLCGITEYAVTHACRNRIC